MPRITKYIQQIHFSIFFNQLLVQIVFATLHFSLQHNFVICHIFSVCFANKRNVCAFEDDTNNPSEEQQQQQQAKSNTLNFLCNIFDIEIPLDVIIWFYAFHLALLLCTVGSRHVLCDTGMVLHCSCTWLRIDWRYSLFVALAVGCTIGCWLFGRMSCRYCLF